MAKKPVISNADTSGKSGPGAVASAGAPPRYVVLARKYRPTNFGDLIGQDAMVRTLSNAFASGRIAQGYMLTGVRGVGKTTTARILARALNFARDAHGSEPAVDRPTIDLPKDPALYGRHCQEILESRHADVIEMDAASNTGIDNIREIIESARYKPLVARYKVFIIDEVHMLSKGAFNALLKTLEEPPEHVKFIFATTEIRKVPVTVLSRCQRFDLRRVDVPVLAEHFRRIVAAEGSSAADEALTLIARAAEGSVRDGLSILDQAIAFSTGEVSGPEVRTMLGLADRGRIFDLLDQLFAGDCKAALGAFAGLHRDGADPAQIMADLAEAVHVVTRVKAVGAEAGGEVLSAEESRRAAHLAGKLSVPLLSRCWQMLTKGLEEVSRSGSPLAAAEMVLIRIAYTADLPSPDDIIRVLGSGGGAGGSAARPGAPAPASGGATRPALNELPATATPTSGGPAGRATAPSAPHPRPAPTLVASARATPASPAAAASPRSQPPPVASVDDYGSSGGDDDSRWAASAYDEDAGDAELADPGDAIGSRPAHVLPDPRSFAEVVALVGQMRDVRLKLHLEEEASLVKFDAAAPSIDLFLLPGAPAEIANELREKLNKWTQRRWVVLLSRARGETPLGEVRRQREAAELEELKRHPAVAAILAEFPDARIADIRHLAINADEETGTG